MITRSLAADTRVSKNKLFLSSIRVANANDRELVELQGAPAMNTKMAVNALRYQLEHPLTSHDDSELYPAHFQQPTQAHLVSTFL
jgi:hypothetical protein